MKREPAWDLYRTFATVMREGSLSAAARSMGMSQPSVARHVAALEEAVGGALFIRSQRGLSPTERAKRLQRYADTMMATSAAFLRVASADPTVVEGTVRITAAEVIAIERLPPILAGLRQAHPALEIELEASDAISDLLGRQADIAIRMVKPVQQALVARTAGAVTLGLYAHPDYLAGRRLPSSLAELGTFDLIGMDDGPASREIFRAAPDLARHDFALRTNNTVAQVAAIRAGFGIGVCQVGLASRHPALIRLLPESFAIDLPLWVAMHEDLRTDTRCRTVFDALVTGLARSSAADPKPAIRHERVCSARRNSAL